MAKRNSDVNIFSPASTSSFELGEDFHREVTENHERKMVLEIVDRIFDEQTGIYNGTSSICLTPEKPKIEHDCDKRLKYWKDMLKERKRIAQRIQNTIGKPAHDVLFHRNTVVDQEKDMVKRILDFSDRMNPLKLVTKRLLKMREYCNLSTCLTVNELSETLPKPEKDKKARIEIIGMPNVTKQEQFGQKLPCKKSAWLESRALEETIEKKREDIERVVDFYPDIENLQVVGESLFQNVVVKHNSDIKLVHEDIIKTVSTETSAPVDECKHESKVIKEDPAIAYGIRVNEYVYVVGAKRSAQYVEIEARFDCFPFETVVKRVVHLENIGQKILNVELVQRNYYHKVQPLLRSQDDEFVIDYQPFRLIAGEKRDIVVLYQPRKVDVVKQQWLLKLDPQFFCRKSDAIVLKLSGRCKPPVEYVQKINGIVKNVIEKSNMKMMHKLGRNLGALTPIIKPTEVICPYRRTLNEREIFEQLNPSYTCERYHDLELLKDIHKRVKKPREPAWDLKLETLFNQIMRLDSPDRRALIFNEAMGILEYMKGNPIELESKIEISPERERSRFLYVRGVMCAAIEEWEALIAGIEDAFTNQAFKIHRARAEEYGDGAGGDGAGGDGAGGDVAGGDRPIGMEELLFNVDEEKLREIITRKVRRQKPYRDSIFVQTYTHLCNFAEDIVSVIESTELV